MPRVGTLETPLRQSTAKAAMVCEQQAEFVIDGAPAERTSIKAIAGTLVHSCLEHLHRTGDPTIDPWELLLEKRAEVYAEELERGLTAEDIAAIDEDLETLREQIANYVTLGYYEKHHRGLIGVEVKWRAEIGGWHCAGTMDLLQEPWPGTIILVDFKSGLRSSEHARGLDIQLPLYASGVLRGEIFVNGEWTTLGRLPAHAIIFETRGLNRYKRLGPWGRVGDLKGQPEREVYLTSDRLMRLEKEIEEICLRLNGDFWAEEGQRLGALRNGVAYGACWTCRFRDRCEVAPLHDWITESQLVSRHDTLFQGGEF